MKTLLLIALAFVSAQDGDIDIGAATHIAESKAAIQKLDQESKTAPPERKAELAAQRTDEVGKIEKTAEGSPKSPAVNLAAGGALLEVNEPAKAKPFAEKAVQLAPNNPEARVVRGNVHFELGNYREAAEDAKAALRLDPKSAPANALLKFAESRLEDVASRVKLPPKSALQQSRDAPELQAADSRPERELASAGPAAAIPGRDALAAQRMKAVETLEDARGRLKLGDREGAARLGQKAALLAPGDGKVRAQAAFLRYKAGDAAGAFEDAEQATALDASAENYLLLAALHDALGQAPLARAQLTRAARLSPRYANFVQKAASMAPADFTRFLDAELSAKFTPQYEAALSGLGGGRGPSSAAPTGGGASEGAFAAGARGRWALAGVGGLLLLGLLWGLADRVRDRD